MIEVSSRYALGIAILATLALLPFLAHRGSRFLHEDCRDPGVLLRPAAAPEGEAPVVPEELRRLPRTRVEARRLPLGDDGHLDLYVVQAFNPAIAYKPTELYFFEGRSAERRDVERLERDGESLPVHRAYYDPPGSAGRTTLVGYLVVFDSKPVSNPYLAELREGPKQLLSGRRPFWVFFVHGRVKRSAREAAEGVLHEALASTWEEYRAACLPQPGSGT